MRHTLPLESRIEFGNRQYIIRSVLGEGGSGIVYKIESAEQDNITSGIYALKEIFPVSTFQSVFLRKGEGNYTVIGSDMRALEEAKEAARKEYNRTRLVNNILPSANDMLQIQDKAMLYVDGERQTIENTFLLMRLPIGHTLSELLEEIHKPAVPDNSCPFRCGRFSSMQIRDSLVILRKLLVSLKSIHNGAFEHGLAQPLIHGDLKPENIWLSGLDFTERDTINTASALLLDFGSALELDRRTMSATVKKGVDHLTGTIGYVPWEAKNLDRVNYNLTPSYDLFSIGVVFTKSLCLFTNFEALYSSEPENQNFKELDQKLYRQFRSENRAVVEELVSFIHQALANDPLIRFQSCEDMLQALDGLMDTVNNRGLTPSVLRKNIFKEGEKYNKIIPELLPPLCSEGKTEDERATFANIGEAVLHLDEKYIQIIGNEGGSGKSSCIRYLQQKLLRFSTLNIPFLIDLKAYHSGDDFMLREAVSKYAGKDIAALGDRIHHLENLIREKPDCRFYFLVDGVQDSRDPYADSVFEELSTNNVYLSPNVTVIIMTKTRLFNRMFNNDKGFAIYDLLPLSRETVWQVMKEHGITTCDERVCSVCESPMLLSIALELLENGKSLSEISTESDLFQSLYDHMCSMELFPDNKEFPLHVFRDLKDFTIRNLIPEICFAMYRVGVTVISSKQLEGVISECLSSATGNDVMSKSRLVWNDDFESSVREIISTMKRFGICEFNENNELYIHQRERDFLYCLLLKQRMETEKSEKWDDLTTGLLEDHISQLLAGLFRDHHTIVAWLNRRCGVRSTDSDEVKYRKQVATANMMRCLGVIKEKIVNEDFSDLDFTLCDLSQFAFVHCQFVRCVLTNKIAEALKPVYTDVSEPLDDLNICCGIQDDILYLFSSVTGEVLNCYRANGVKWNSVGVKDSMFIVAGVKTMGHSPGNMEFAPWLYYITVDPISGKMQLDKPISYTKEESLWSQYIVCADVENSDAKLSYLGEDIFLYSYRSSEDSDHHYRLTWMDSMGKELYKMENVWSFQVAHKITVGQINNGELAFYDTRNDKGYSLKVENTVVRFHLDYYGEYLSILCYPDTCMVFDVRKHRWIANMRYDKRHYISDFYYLPHTDSALFAGDEIRFVKDIQSSQEAYSFLTQKENEIFDICGYAIIRYTPTGLLIGQDRSVYYVQQDNIRLLWEEKASFGRSMVRGIFVPKERTLTSFVQDGWIKIVYSDGTVLQIDLGTERVTRLKGGNRAWYETIKESLFGGFLRIRHDLKTSQLELWDKTLKLRDIMFLDVPVWQTAFVNNRLFIVDLELNLWQATLSEDGFFDFNRTKLSETQESFVYAYGIGPNKLAKKAESNVKAGDYWFCDILKSPHHNECIIICITGPDNTLALFGINTDGALATISFRHRITQKRLKGPVILSAGEDRIWTRIGTNSDIDYRSMKKRINKEDDLYVDTDRVPIEEASFEQIWKAGYAHAPELEMNNCSFPEGFSSKRSYFFSKNGLSIICSDDSCPDAKRLIISPNNFCSWYEFRMPQDFYFSGEGIEVSHDQSLLVLRGISKKYQFEEALLVAKMEKTDAGVHFYYDIFPFHGSSTFAFCGNDLLTLEDGNKLRKSIISFDGKLSVETVTILANPMINCTITDSCFDDNIKEKCMSGIYSTNTIIDSKTISKSILKGAGYGRYKSKYLAKQYTIIEKILTSQMKIQIPLVVLKVGERYNLHDISKKTCMPLQGWKLQRKNNAIMISGDTLIALHPGVACITTNWYGQKLETNVFVEGVAGHAMEQLRCYIDDFRSSPELRWYMKNGEKFFIKEDLPSISLAGSKYVDHAYEKALKKIIADQTDQSGIYSIQNPHNISILKKTYYIYGSVSPKMTFFDMLRDNEIREQMLKSSVLLGICMIYGKRGHWLISFD